MATLLEDSTDAQKLGTRSIKRVHQKIKNKNKPNSNITNNQRKLTLNKNVFKMLELLHKKCKFNNVNKTNSEYKEYKF